MSLNSHVDAPIDHIKQEPVDNVNLYYKKTSLINNEQNSAHGPRVARTKQRNRSGADARQRDHEEEVRGKVAAATRGVRSMRPKTVEIRIIHVALASL